MNTLSLCKLSPQWLIHSSLLRARMEPRPRPTEKNPSFTGFSRFFVLRFLYSREEKWKRKKNNWVLATSCSHRRRLTIHQHFCADNNVDALRSTEFLRSSFLFTVKDQQPDGMKRWNNWISSSAAPGAFYKDKDFFEQQQQQQQQKTTRANKVDTLCAIHLVCGEAQRKETRKNKVKKKEKPNIWPLRKRSGRRWSGWGIWMSRFFS